MSVARFLLILAFVSRCVFGDLLPFTAEGRDNLLYVPDAAGGGDPLPLVIALHGCTQDPQDFSNGIGLNDIAETQSFFVLYPEQPSTANTNKCWNWFLPKDQVRVGGEPEIIYNIYNAVLESFGSEVDVTRVYALGLSAGGAMSVILGATYPDVFSAIGVSAGLEYEAASTALGGFLAMSMGGPDPVQQGKKAYLAMDASPFPLGVFIIHGSKDYTVQAVNSKQVRIQWTTTLNLVLGHGQDKGHIPEIPATETHDQVPDGHKYSVFTYQDEHSGTPYITYVDVIGMGHAWSGGSTDGSYTDPKGPDASLLIVNFFWSFNHSTPVRY